MKELESLKAALSSAQDAAISAGANTAAAYDAWLRGGNEYWDNYSAARDNSNALWKAFIAVDKALEESLEEAKEEQIK